MEQNQEQLNFCPICQSNEIPELLQVKDFFLSQENFVICQCKQCGFKFTNPRPNQNSIGVYYKSDNYYSHSNSKSGIIPGIYQWVRNYTLKKKYLLISKFSKKGTILDIGCATGQFLHQFKKQGWNCVGIEPNDEAREFAVKNYSLDVQKGDLENFPSQSFGVITMWHVLEHVHDLKNTMTQLKRIVNSDGVLFIALPNIESWDANHYKEYWAGLDVPRHLYHFGRNNVEELFNNYGFKLVETKPMIFDSFYVSMLSEKYKSNPFYLFSAFSMGFISNIAGMGKKPNHSSLIYIFKPI